MDNERVARYQQWESETHGYRYPDRGVSRLYAAEDSISDRRFRSLDEVLRFLDRRVIRHPWWVDNVTRHAVSEGVMPVLQVTAKPEYKRSGRRGAASIWWEPWWDEEPVILLRLPRWAWTENVVLHELSHMTVDPRIKQCHGPAYARKRLEAQYLFTKTGPELEAAYEEYRVRR